MKACFLILAAVVAVAWAEAPYPPSGWRPAKAFLLPVRQRQNQDAYGPPLRPSYGPPPTTAEPEPETTTVEQETTTEVAEEATEAATEASTGENAVEGGRSDDAAESQPAGLYYILLPDGRLQRVLYTAGSPQVGYSAQLRIHDVEPVPPAPVYAYAGPLTRILRK